jgi:hypothetical protein
MSDIFTFKTKSLVQTHNNGSPPSHSVAAEVQSLLAQLAAASLFPCPRSSCILASLYLAFFLNIRFRPSFLSFSIKSTINHSSSVSPDIQVIFYFRLVPGFGLVLASLPCALNTCSQSLAVTLEFAHVSWIRTRRANGDRKLHSKQVNDPICG